MSIEVFHRCQVPCVQIFYSPDVKKWLGFCCFFVVFLLMALALPSWEFWSSSTCCKASWDSMSLSVEENLRMARSSLWSQGEFYIMMLHWRSVKPTFDVSRRYSRADVGMTFTVSASCRYTLQMNLCLCSLFSVSRLWRVLRLLCCMCLGSREYKLFVLAKIKHL